MAVLLPTLASSVGRMQAGERRFAERLLQKLEDDYLCWYDVPIGEKQFHPDFIVFNPRRGVLVLEVKDWKIETIQRMDRYHAWLLTGGGTVNQAVNPLEHARMNALRVDTLLRSDPALRNPPQHQYPGKLVMPYGYGAVLTTITRKQFEQFQLENVIEPGRVICKDEMLESVDPEAFQQRLWDMFAHVFPVTRARISHGGIERWPYVEEVSRAGLERKPWLFHGLSEAQATGPADRPAPISLRSIRGPLNRQTRSGNHRRGYSNRDRRRPREKFGLCLPQIERVRWHLFPELRISTAANQFGLIFDDAAPAGSANSPPGQPSGDSAGTPPKARPLLIPDLIKVMDTHQEQLARSMGDGHRVIHGVAGSGKTMILGYRSLHLARTLQKPVLVLCYNVTLAARLKQLLSERGAGEQVCVRSFHEWCGDLHTSYQVPRPKWQRDYAANTAALVESTINAVDRGKIPRAQYGAVLIDERHDFEPEWFKLVAQMVDPATNSLLVLYDDAQSIYAKGRSKKFSFASVGIQAKGRTTILRLNYRNTVEILSVAKAFAEDLLNVSDGADAAAVLIADKLTKSRSLTEGAASLHSSIRTTVAKYFAHAM